MRIELELRNMPTFRIMEYLVEAGGTLIGERSAQGDGWTAVLQELEPAVFRVMKVPRDLLVIEGDAAQPIGDFMRRKTMRGGG